MPVLGTDTVRRKSSLELDRLVWSDNTHYAAVRSK